MGQGGVGWGLQERLERERREREHEYQMGFVRVYAEEADHIRMVLGGGGGVGRG